MKATLLIGVATICLPLQAYAQDEFCQALRKIVAIPLKGGNLDALKTSRKSSVGLYANFNLPGAKDCEIQPAQFGEAYRCSLELSNSKAAGEKARSLDTLIGSCFADFQRSVKTFPDGIRFDYSKMPIVINMYHFISPSTETEVIVRVEIAK